MARTDVLHGTLDLLILNAVAAGPLHGLGVSRRIAQMTAGRFAVQAGSLFPALYRLEERGWLAATDGESENHRRARFYRLTRSGRRQLDVETREWAGVAAAIALALGSNS